MTVQRFYFHQLISKITVKKLTLSNEKLVARIMQFVNGETK